MIFQQRILLLALAIGFPGSLMTLILLWTGDYSLRLRITLTTFLMLFWIGLAFHLQRRVVRPLQTVSNLLAALREGDYSIRAHIPLSREDSLAEVGFEINALEETLRNQRLDAVEATALLRRLLDVIDVAIYAFDEDRKLRLVNRYGERLLALPAERLLGRDARSLGLEECLEGTTPRTLELDLPGKSSRWGLRRGVFRESGRPHQLLVLADLSQALREEERQAWQRLVRVLGHELNNSLTPVKSMAQSLVTMLKTEPKPGDWEDDVLHGLNVIHSRTQSLTRFMSAYSRLTRLPAPKMAPVDLAALVERVTRLETRRPIKIDHGPETTIHADPDQMEQLLINLLKNAAEAALTTDGQIMVRWDREDEKVAIRILDDGPGLPKTSNLFVPFFTTKPQGSGIGLVLSRQIAEAHGGSLTLNDRRDHQGCEALLELPLTEAASA